MSYVRADDRIVSGNYAERVPAGIGGSDSAFERCVMPRFGRDRRPVALSNCNIQGIIPDAAGGFGLFTGFVSELVADESGEDVTR